VTDHAKILAPVTDATILAVDDQPQNLRLLDAILSPRGYRVRGAASGEEALELLSEPPTWYCWTS
jgi:CheY-like chemotaxis protein